jgi:hypothetical protein
VSLRLDATRSPSLAERGLSLRQYCKLIGMSRATPGYRPRVLVKGAPVIEAIKELSTQFPHYGNRRILIFLRRRDHDLIRSRIRRDCSRSAQPSRSSQSKDVLDIVDWSCDASSKAVATSFR